MNNDSICIENHSLIIDEACHGQRLDQAIAPLFPSMGVRGRRRLWEHNLIKVNGRVRPYGFSVSTGDVVEIEEKVGEIIKGCEGCDNLQRVNIISINCELGLATVYKPSGIHSATIAGSPQPSVEALLSAMDFMGTSEGFIACEQGFPRLLNRLDGPTSGMLLVALNDVGLRTWGQAEERGNIEKNYFAVACGVVEKAQIVKTALGTANRQITKIEDYETPDTLRHTKVTPLAVFEMPMQGRCEGGVQNVTQPVTLVQCHIHKGARHQIRAHMASIGHALVGDTLYGTSQAKEAMDQLFLHHGRVEIESLTAFCMPPWLSLLPLEAQERLIALSHKNAS